jgi:hypothetical protein
VIDKLLLLLLIILLPVGIVASRQLFQPSLSEDKQIEVQTKKVEELMSKLNTQLDKKSSQSKTSSDFSITAVTNSSESGVIRVAGVAPTGKISVYYTAVNIPKDIIPELNKNQVVDKKVLGESVQIKALKTNPDGTFILEYPVKGTNEIVEFVLTQDQSQMIIQYDLGLNKRIL